MGTHSSGPKTSQGTVSFSHVWLRNWHKRLPKTLLDFNQSAWPSPKVWCDRENQSLKKIIKREMWKKYFEIFSYHYVAGILRHSN